MIFFGGGGGSRVVAVIVVLSRFINNFAMFCLHFGFFLIAIVSIFVENDTFMYGHFCCFLYSSINANGGDQATFEQNFSGNFLFLLERTGRIWGEGI